jgi:hypothetical protein
MGYISNGGNGPQGGSPPRGDGSNPIRGGYNNLLKRGTSRPLRDQNQIQYATRPTRSWIGCT